NVTALAEHDAAVFVLELAGEMVEDFAVLLVGSNFPTARSAAFHRVRILPPVADVEIVDVLLADMVAAQPVIVVPVFDLIAHFGAGLLARDAGIPHPAAVPVDPHGDDVTDRTASQLL